MGLPEEKRDLLKILTSNRDVVGKNVVVKLHSPFSEIANRPPVTAGDPQRDQPRTFERIFNVVARLISEGTLPRREVFYTRCGPLKNIPTENN